MRRECFEIGPIPVVLWGEASRRVVIAVHGNQSSKTDFPIELLAGNYARDRHYFYTPEQLRIFSGWLNRTIEMDALWSGGL